MVQFIDQKREDEYPKYDPIVDAEHDQGKVDEHLVDDDFEPVRSKRGNPVHDLDAVVQLVEPPQPPVTVVGPVDIPFEEVLDEKKCDELGPRRPARDKSQRFGMRQTDMEKGTVQPGNGVDGENRQHPAHILDIEDHPEQVLHKIRPEHLLRSRPGYKAFECKYRNRKQQEPEIVLEVDRHDGGESQTADRFQPRFEAQINRLPMQLASPPHAD